MGNTNQHLFGPLSRYFSGALEHPQDFNPVQAGSYAIRQDVAGIGHHELSSAVDAPWMAKSRIVCQKIYGLVDSLNHKPCGLGVFLGNVVGLLVEVLKGCGQPPNLHLPPI